MLSKSRSRPRKGALAALCLLLAGAAHAEDSGLLFHVSGDRGLTADVAKGQAAPNFASNVSIQQDSVRGAYIQAQGTQALTWMAPGNIYAERGTLSFYWRARDPLGPTAFPIFRVAYADHTSWDMVWLRIDWNGHGYDAFVTDTNLSRLRVSIKLATVPAATEWTLITFSWDETSGVTLYLNGKKAGSRAGPAVLDAGLDQFGPHSRVISPHQVHSMYPFIRGGDIDDIRIYDHALSDAEVAQLAAGTAPAAPTPVRTATDAAWAHRYGFDSRTAPVVLSAPATRIRKVAFTGQFDLKERMTLGSDGMAETTWPGVYNRSKLPGRHDYFELPDWNVYVEGGKAITFTLPDEPFNHVEFQGAAYGTLTYQKPGTKEVVVGTRPQGVERNAYDFSTLTGGALRFENAVQETPIQELAAYNVSAGVEPDEKTLTYKVRATVDIGEYPSIDALRAYVAGRYQPDERATVVALPVTAPSKPAAAPGAGLPIVHILIPEDLRQWRDARPVNMYEYGWEGIDGGLDGIALDIPALKVKAGADGLYPLNIAVKDPLWPARDLLNVTVSVKPDEARTVFLDTRDRILPDGRSLYLTMAGGTSDFDAGQLDGMTVRLKFKPYKDALPEHIADRFAEARDNLAFLVEEHTQSKRLSRFVRLNEELKDLLKVDPQNVHGREMWAEMHPDQGPLPAPGSKVPDGVPAWAWLQTQDLKRVRTFIDWWIDNRQVPYGDFGGGISDDDDLTQQWPPLALMGVEPEKITGSLNALTDAVFKNGMITDGLGTIKTDELHSYEEGINAISEAMYTSYGDPRVIERLMATARAYPRIVQKGVDGHTYVISRYFSGTDVSLDAPWNWSHAYSPLILHPGTLLGDFNANPGLRRTVTSLADTYLAKATKNTDGTLAYPEELQASTGKARGDLKGDTRANNAMIQLFWESWRWTGDEKYLAPIRNQVARGSLTGLSFINGDAPAALKLGARIGAPLKARADANDPWALYYTWNMTGDLKALEKLYANEIAFADQHMWLYTDAHWWSDRVELPSNSLQRTRLGGVVLTRNQTVPGHLVSWRFDRPLAAEDVGILVSDPSARHFKVTAYNLSNAPIHAVMTGWEIAGGRWTVTDSSGAKHSIDLERTASTDLTFAPGIEQTWEFTLTTPGDDPAQRPDLGIGREDIKMGRNSLSVTVHSLGSRDAPASAVVLEDASGHELARTIVAALPSAADLNPHTATVTLKVTGTLAPGAAVRIVTPQGVKEITQRNNRVEVAPAPAHS